MKNNKNVHEGNYPNQILEHIYRYHAALIYKMIWNREKELQSKPRFYWVMAYDEHDTALSVEEDESSMNGGKQLSSFQER